MDERYLKGIAHGVNVAYVDHARLRIQTRHTNTGTDASASSYPLSFALTIPTVVVSSRPL